MEILNLEKLGAYLEHSIEGFIGLDGAEKFSGGQSNPTYLLNAASGRYVLRSKPPGRLLKSAHAVDREFRVIQALAGTDVPVAMALHLCENESVTGSMFYVMSFEEGRIFWNPALPAINKEKRAGYHHELIRVLAAIHEVDIDAVGLTDYGRPGNYYERQISRWTKQYRTAETTRIEPMDILIDWLPANLPADDGQNSLIHGDYRIDNIIFHTTDVRALAVIDWELSTLGHPLADLAYYCMCLRLPLTETSRVWPGKIVTPGGFRRNRLLLNSMVSIAGCRLSRTGIFILRSVFFVWRQFVKACINAGWMATLPIIKPWRWVSLLNQWRFPRLTSLTDKKRTG